MFEPIGPAPADVVRMDAHTLKDLEIFEGSGGASSLYDRIDQTRTTGGSKVLKERLQRPWASAERIRGVQAALGFILDHRQTFERLPSDLVTTEVDAYLKASLPLVVSENRFEVFIGALEVRFGDFRPYGQIVRGVVRTSKLVRALKSLVAGDALPAAGRGEVGFLLDEVRALVSRPAFDVVPEDERWDLPSWTVLGLDRVFRYREHEALFRLLKLVYEIDALVSMADALTDYGLVMPEVIDGPLELDGAGLFNLFVERPVPASLALDQ